MVEEKACTRCGEVKSLADGFYFDRANNNYRSDCKYCNKARKRVWRAELGNKAVGDDFEVSDGVMLPLYPARFKPPMGGCELEKRGCVYRCEMFEVCQGSAAWGGPVACKRVAVEERAEFIFIW